MAIPRLRAALLNHDLKVSKEIAKSNLEPKGLISTLYELIFFSLDFVSLFFLSLVFLCVVMRYHHSIQIRHH